MSGLSALTPADIATIMRIERGPGYDAFVGRWEADEHAAEMASPDTRYLGLREDGSLAGFVILQEFRRPTILLRRIAVSDAGRGTGTRLLRAVMDWVFEQTTAQGLRLDVLPANARARRVYAREGFLDDGEAVIHELPHILMSASRARWAQMRATAAP